MTTQSAAPRTAEELRDLVLRERDKGHVVLSGLPGQLIIAPVEQLVSRHVDGLLYDLNRLEEISLTFLTDPKWINDFAVALVIRKLHGQLAAANERIAQVERERDEARRRADTKYQTVAKAVFETVQDGAATWDTAGDELIWGNYDSNGPQHQLVTDVHLKACCVRFPQWADDLRDFATRWNSDTPLTDKEIESVEIPPEDLERSTRRMLQAMNFYHKLHKAEDRAFAAESRCAELREAEGFVARHSEPWYTSGQTLLRKIRDVLAKEANRG